MIRSAWLPTLCLLCPVALLAQTVVAPEPPLDSARATLRDALMVFRDSVGTINGAASRLQRDFRQTSAASLESRARVMHDACARSSRTLPPTRKAVLSARLPDRGRPMRRELVDVMDRLKGALSRCQIDFAAMSQPGQAETVRGYGYDRSERVQGALRTYEQILRRFLAATGIGTLPPTSAPRSAAGGGNVDSHLHILWTEPGSPHDT